MKCRNCHHELTHVFVDLINCPPSNDMLKAEQLNEPEVLYPLKIFTCDNCMLVQVDEMRKAESIFNSEYTYFSSYSVSWLSHAKRYVDMMMNRFKFDSSSLVIEIASNDGYLLQYFREYNVPVLGIDPTANTANVAISKGIPTLIDFFSYNLSVNKIVKENKLADLILGNNVLAHVPDINDFVKGVKTALKPGGVVTFEFPHLLRLVEDCQFDTIYHEHFSYLSFMVVKRIFEEHELELFDVEELSTHGGSLRIFAKHKGDQSKQISQNVSFMIEKEKEAGMMNMPYYNGFQPRVEEIKYAVWEFLITSRKQDKKVIAYGAAAKGNTLLNYCGIKGTDLIQFAVDASPHKQNRYLPASHIPVRDLNSISSYKPDYVIILPWNLREEISEQLHYIRDWGGKFVTFIPQISIF